VKTSTRLSLVAGLLVWAVLLVAATTACGGEESTLEGTRWIMTKYAVSGGVKDALPDPVVDATFATPRNGEGQVSGSGGLNQYSGTYKVDGKNLTVGTISSTRVAGNPAVMQQEADYLTALQTAATHEIDGNTLTIENRSGFVVLVYRAAE
jgi:heat shock protein HslJ